MSTRRFQALGRLRLGQMNQTEAKYAAHLGLRKAAGEVLWFAFEGVKLRLADNTFYTPDFAVLTDVLVLEMHDVKGARAIVTDDAKVKIKVAASSFPFIFRLAFPVRGGGWDIEEI